jgi:hypothetical protein
MKNQFFLLVLAAGTTSCNPTSDATTVDQIVHVPRDGAARIPLQIFARYDSSAGARFHYSSWSNGYGPGDTYESVCGSRSDVDDDGAVAIFDECMAQSIVAVVSDGLATLQPEVDVDVVLHGFTQLDFEREGLTSTLDGIDGIHEVLAATERSEVPLAGVVNIFLTGLPNSNGGSTFANRPLNPSSPEDDTYQPSSIVIAADGDSRTGLGSIITHELGHVLGMNKHLPDGFTFSGCGIDINVPSFEELSVAPNCDFWNFMGSFIPEDGTCNLDKRLRFDTPKHAALLKDVVACWLHENNLAILPSGWPTSAAE